MKETIRALLGVLAVIATGVVIVASIRNLKEPLPGGTRGIPIQVATESAHPNSDAEVDQEHALCFIAILQGSDSVYSLRTRIYHRIEDKDHCKQHRIDYYENGDFWAI